MADDLNLRVRAAIAANPMLSWDAATALIQQQDSDEALSQTIAAGEQDYADFLAAGKPGGMDAFYDGSWRDVQKAPADPEAALREMVTDDGRLSKEVIERILKGQEADAKAAREQREAAGYPS
jgi:hypothetical protein